MADFSSRRLSLVKHRCPIGNDILGRMMRFDIFDAMYAYGFVQQNRNKAPEPHAD